MIGRDGDRYILGCDVCEQIEPEDFDEFVDVIKFKQDNGWTSQKDNGEWIDVCNKCHEAARKAFVRVMSGRT